MATARRGEWSARLANVPTRTWVGIAVVLFAAGTSYVLERWGGVSFLPGFVGEFGASLLAFVLALRWDHERERQRAHEEAASRMEEEQRAETQHHDQLVIEARRRLEPVRKELGANKKSVDYLAKAMPAAMAPGAPPMALHPQLLEGAWAANAPRLSEILSDYELVGDLAFTYGRIEELRWRLRQRTAALTEADIAKSIDTMTEPLVRELVDEVADRLKRVRQAANDPPVRGGVQVAGMAVEVLVAAPTPTESVSAHS